MMLVELGAAVIAFALGIFEFYQTRQYTRYITHHGGAGTSPFALITVFTSGVFGGLMIIGGVGILIHMFAH